MNKTESAESNRIGAIITESNQKFQSGSLNVGGTSMGFVPIKVSFRQRFGKLLPRRRLTPCVAE
jgi:hypothetical protein